MFNQQGKVDLPMRAALVLFVVAACSTKEGPHARGALVFDAREAADVFLATEAEVMRSEPILRRVREDQRAELAPAAITAKRRAGTMILDVTVRDKDPQRAAELCNRLIQTYLEYRMSRAIEAIAREQQVVAEALDRDRGNAELQKKLQDLDVKRMTRTNDVRVLDPCLAARKQ